MAAAASRWKVGDKVMALYEDDNWYRAEVLGVDVAEGQTVYLIGYEDSDKQEYLYEASVEARGAVKDAGDEADAKEREQTEDAAETAPQESEEERRARYEALSPRLRVIVEMLESENKYVEDLKMIGYYYVEPIQRVMEMERERILDKDTFGVLFSKLALVEGLNGRFLAELDKRFQQNPEHPVISDLFLQYAPFFKMYSEYISHLEKNILPLLRKLTKGKSRFAEYNAGVEATSGTTLEEFLTLPARHISLYTDQLRRLVEAVEKKDKEYEQLQKAHAVMQQVSSAITTNLETRKNLDVVAELEKKFVVNPKFSKPGRYIIREGNLVKKSREIGGEDRDYRVFLFSDMFAYASSVGLGWKMKLHDKIDIDSSFQVRKLPVVQGENRLLVASSVKTIVWVAKDAAACDSWIKSLQMAIEKKRQSIPEKLRKVPLGVAPLPIWLPYDSVPDVEALFPQGTTTGGFNADPNAVSKNVKKDVGEKGAASKAVARDLVAEKLVPVTRTFVNGEKPVQVAAPAKPARAAAPAAAPAPAVAPPPAMPAGPASSPEQQAAMLAYYQQMMLMQQYYYNQAAYAGGYAAGDPAAAVPAAVPAPVPAPPAAAAPAPAGSPAKFCGACGAPRGAMTQRFCDQCGSKLA